MFSCRRRRSAVAPDRAGITTRRRRADRRSCSTPDALLAPCRPGSPRRIRVEIPAHVLSLAIRGASEVGHEGVCPRNAEVVVPVVVEPNTRDAAREDVI